MKGREFVIHVEGNVLIEAPNEFEAQRVISELWFSHRARGSSTLGRWEAEGQAHASTAVVREILASPAIEPVIKVAPPPPERRYSRSPDPDLELF
jgi:hypothetical protein